MRDIKDIISPFSHVYFVTELLIKFKCCINFFTIFGIDPVELETATLKTVYGAGISLPVIISIAVIFNLSSKTLLFVRTNCIIT